MWLLYAIGASMLWGLNYSLNERVFQDRIHPTTLLVFQGLATSGVALAMGLFRLVPDLRTVAQDRSTLYLVVGALVTNGVGNLLISLSIQAKNATLAGLVELSYPIFTVLFTYLLFRQLHLTPMIMAGGALILVGIVLVTLG